MFPGLPIKEALWQLCHELDDYSFMGVLLSPSFHSVDHKSVSVSLEWSLCRTAGGVNPLNKSKDLYPTSLVKLWTLYFLSDGAYSLKWGLRK